MAASLKEITIKDTQVPVIFEEGDYIPIVSIQLVFKNAGHLSNTKDGLADLAAKLFNEGTKTDGSIGFSTKLVIQLLTSSNSPNADGGLTPEIVIVLL